MPRGQRDPFTDVLGARRGADRTNWQMVSPSTRDAIVDRQLRAGLDDFWSGRNVAWAIPEELTAALTELKREAQAANVDVTPFPGFPVMPGRVEEARFQVFGSTALAARGYEMRRAVRRHCEAWLNSRRIVCGHAPVVEHGSVHMYETVDGGWICPSCRFAADDGAPTRVTSVGRSTRCWATHRPWPRG